MKREKIVRNSTFDILCGICILRMVTLHAVCQTVLRQAEWWKPIMMWSFFFMSFFFFKAGYFNKGVDGESKTFCWDKFRRLMIPYLSWGAISFAINGCFLLIFPEQLHRSIEALIKFRWWVGGLTVGNSPLWFLLSFFCSYIVVHFYLKAVRNRWLQYLGFLVFPFVSYWLSLHGNPLWFMTSNVFCGVFFFILGREWHKILNFTGRNVGFIISTILTSLFIYLNIHAHAEYEMKSNEWVGSCLLVLSNTTLALTGFSGLLLTTNVPRIPIISYIGQHSMVYYVSHYPIILSYTHISTILGHSIHKSVPDLIASLIITFVICTLLVPLVERVPWLSGRWPKSKQ